MDARYRLTQKSIICSEKSPLHGACVTILVQHCRSINVAQRYNFRLPLVGEDPSSATLKFAFDGSNDDPSYRMDSRTVACQSPRGSVFYLYFLQVFAGYLSIGTFDIITIRGEGEILILKITFFQPVTGCYRAYCAIPNTPAASGTKRNQVPKLDLMI